jgi:hypothetical protein
MAAPNRNTHISTTVNPAVYPAPVAVIRPPIRPVHVPASPVPVRQPTGVSVLPVLRSPGPTALTAQGSQFPKRLEPKHQQIETRDLRQDSRSANREYVEESEDEIRHNFAKNRQRLLLSRGVDYNSFLRKDSGFVLADALTKIETCIPRITTKIVNIKKQLHVFDTLFTKPLDGNPVIAISSYPTDLKAKQLALVLMNRAVDSYMASRSRNIRNRSQPYWHRIYGGFGDSLRDRNSDSTDYPCFLVLSNLDFNSTVIKLEKARDLLDRFSDIPRIVITSPDDPLTFFATKLHLQASAGIYLGPEPRYRDI